MFAKYITVEPNETPETVQMAYSKGLITYETMVFKLMKLKLGVR